MNCEDSILIVGSPSAELETLHAILSRAGIDAEVVETYPSAEIAIADCPPHLIILNAIEHCQQLKSAPQTCHIPIILVGSVSAEGRARAFEAGVADVIAEPLVPQELVAKVRTHLQVAQLQRQLDHEMAERNRIEAEYQTQLHLFESLLDTVPDTIEIIDPHTFEYIRWNKACTQISGYTDEEFGVRNPTEGFFDPADMWKVEQTVEKVMAGERGTVAANIIKKDGSKVPMEFTAAMAYNASGDPLYFISIGRDISERLRIEHQLEQIAAGAERERLTRRLHDDVTQTLFSASVIAESTPRIMDKNPALASRNLEQLAIMLRSALAEMRTLLLELRPAALVGKSLAELIETLIEASKVKLNCPIYLEVEGDARLSEEATIVFYRIAQEALANIIKYAEATKIEVGVCCRDGEVRLSVADNGQGFEYDKIPPGHFGLRMMAERVARIGGNLVIESDLGRGTTIIATLPKP